MNTLLYVRTSLHGTQGASSQLAERFVARMAVAQSWRARDYARPRCRPGAASHGRALPGVQHPARGSHAGATRCRRVLRRADRRASQRRHHRAWRADVQLRRAIDAADLLRSHRTRGSHLPLHERRSGRTARGASRVCVRDSWRRLRRERRFAGAVSAPVPALHRHRVRVRVRRRAGSRRGIAAEEPGRLHASRSRASFAVDLAA